MNSHATIARWTAVGASTVWAAVLYFGGITIDGDVRRALAYLPTAAGFAVVAFDLWIWKLPGLNTLTGRPRIYGTWAAQIRPRAQSLIPSGGNRGPITAGIVIEQTYWTVAARVYTSESSSKTLVSTIVPDPDSRSSKELSYVYYNTPRQEFSERSHPHHGTTLLRVVGNDPLSLRGSYWTDRLTAGDIVLDRVDRKVNRSEEDVLATVNKNSNEKQ